MRYLDIFEKAPYVFNKDGTWYEVTLEAEKAECDCTGCFFFEDACYTVNRKCNPETRKDKNYVIFRKVSHLKKLMNEKVKI